MSRLDSVDQFVAGTADSHHVGQPFVTEPSIRSVVELDRMDPPFASLAGALPQSRGKVPASKISPVIRSQVLGIAGEAQLAQPQPEPLSAGLTQRFRYAVLRSSAARLPVKGTGLPMGSTWLMSIPLMS